MFRELDHLPFNFLFLGYLVYMNNGNEKDYTALLYNYEIRFDNDTVSILGHTDEIEKIKRSKFFSLAPIIICANKDSASSIGLRKYSNLDSFPIHVYEYVPNELIPYSEELPLSILCRTKSFNSECLDAEIVRILADDSTFDNDGVFDLTLFFSFKAFVPLIRNMQQNDHKSKEHLS